MWKRTHVCPHDAFVKAAAIRIILFVINSHDFFCLISIGENLFQTSCIINELWVLVHVKLLPVSEYESDGIEKCIKCSLPFQVLRLSDWNQQK